MGDTAALVLQYGGWGLLALLIVLIVTQQERVEKWLAIILDLFSWAAASLRRRAISKNIQGNINTLSRSIDHEVPGVMPYNVKLQFVSEMDRAEFLHEENLVVVRIRDRRQEDKNLVHAMLTFCPAGLLPRTRPYLDDTVADALDFTVTRKLLNVIQHQTALTYLYREVMEPEVANRPDLDNICRIFDRLDEQGLFIKVILRELRDFGTKVQSRYPEAAHKDEAKRFIQYMDTIATRAPGEECETNFQGNYISMGFVFIGTTPKIASEGAAPYLRAIQWRKAMNLERTYVAARDWAIDIAERVSYLAEKQNIANVVKRKRYHATDSLGQRREHILIEMQHIAAAPFAPPEQGMLLED